MDHSTSNESVASRRNENHAIKFVRPNITMRPSQFDVAMQLQLRSPSVQTLATDEIDIEGEQSSSITEDTILSLADLKLRKALSDAKKAKSLLETILQPTTVTSGSNKTVESRLELRRKEESRVELEKGLETLYACTSEAVSHSVLLIDAGSKTQRDTLTANEKSFTSRWRRGGLRRDGDAFWQDFLAKLPDADILVTSNTAIGDTKVTTENMITETITETKNDTTLKEGFTELRNLTRSIGPNVKSSRSNVDPFLIGIIFGTHHFRGWRGGEDDVGSYQAHP